MSTYTNLESDTELLKIRTKDDEDKNLKYQTEKHDHENINKNLLKLIRSITKNCKNLNKRKYW